MKDNKLIAEFMGVKPLVLGGSIEYEMYGVLDCIEDFPNEKHFFLDDEMRFHDSWDWLMPVIIKIADMLEATHCPLYRSIDEAYNEAVTFIKTYNDEEKEKSS